MRDDPPRSPTSFIFMCMRQMRLRAEYAVSHTSSQPAERTDRISSSPILPISFLVHFTRWSSNIKGEAWCIRGWLMYAVQTMGGARGGMEQAGRKERVIIDVLKKITQFYIVCEISSS